MPLPEADKLITQPQISFSLSPVHNFLNTLMLLVKGNTLSGIHPWILDVLKSMPKELFEKNKQITIGFFYALTPDRDWPSVEEYLDYMKNENPEIFIDKILNAYSYYGSGLECYGGLRDASCPLKKYNKEEILSSEQNFLIFLSSHYQNK
ncbi:MAG: hypothetical protein MJB14_20915, partial [Spirochaetes bacterium]|nr:hypothetical protein [Spirochaetota bacterium]